MRDYKAPKKTSASTKSEKQKKAAVLPSIPIIRGTLFISVGILILLTLYRFISMQFEPVSEFTIHGNKVLDETTIIQSLKIEEGQTFFSLDPYELSVKVMQHTWIKTARVKKRYPNQLEIWITEKKPVSFLRTKNSLNLLNEEGYVLNILPTEQGWNLPVITDTRHRLKHNTEKLDSANIQRALTLLTLLEGNATLPLTSISEIQVSNPVNFQLITTNNVRIDLGMEHFSQKLTRLSDAMSQLQPMKKKIRRLDLRYNTHLIVQKK